MTEFNCSPGAFYFIIGGLFTFLYFLYVRFFSKHPPSKQDAEIMMLIFIGWYAIGVVFVLLIIPIWIVSGFEKLFSFMLGIKKTN